MNQKTMNTEEITEQISRKIKTAESEFPIVPEIANRWSARSFSDKEISEEKLQELLEAARWAPSAMNEQPWRYVYAFRGTEGFDKLWHCLMPGNQPWAKNAAVLMVAFAKTTYSSNGNHNGSAFHDLGLANAQLFVQATHNDIFGHIMGGFSSDKVQETLQKDEDLKPVCMIALGYLDHHEKLEEPFKSREISTRQRKNLDEISEKF